MVNLVGSRMVNLAGNIPKRKEGKARSANNAPDKPTVDFKVIEAQYREDAITFNTINLGVQVTMHPGFNIIAPETSTQEYFDIFFEEMGKIGEPTTLTEMLEYIVQDMLVYGNAYVELVYNEADTEIVDLKMLDAKKMDLARDANKNVSFDEFGRVIGYCMTFPYGTNVENAGDKIPEEYEKVVSKESNQIFLLPKRIAHFKLFTFGERVVGVGIIEPTVQDTDRKNKIEEAQANYIYTRGTNTVIANVGDERHEATPQDLQDVISQLVNFKHDRYFAFPDWIKISTLESKSSELVDQTLDYLLSNQVAASGMPKALVTGSGEATNRATLQNQQQMMELSFEARIKKIEAQFNRQILNIITFVNLGESTIAPKLKWNDIRIEEKDSKAKRILEEVREGIITVEEARVYFLKSEDLVENIESFENRGKEVKEVKEIKEKDDESQIETPEEVDKREEEENK